MLATVWQHDAAACVCWSRYASVMTVQPHSGSEVAKLTCEQNSSSAAMMQFDTLSGACVVAWVWC